MIVFDTCSWEQHRNALVLLVCSITIPGPNTSIIKDP